MGITKIEWTSPPRTDGSIRPGYTVNLWWGCTVVHAGCDHCYARDLSHRYNHAVWGNESPRILIKSALDKLRSYQRQAELMGEYRLVFIGSMMDIFELPMPVLDHRRVALPYTSEVIRNQLFDQIDQGLFPNLRFLFLTKRPSLINRICPAHWLEQVPQTVFYGASVVDEATLRQVLYQLRQVRGRKFLSIEPQLGPISLTSVPAADLQGIEWIIQGGESGTQRRPFDTDWAYRLRDECASRNIPYFFKQIDKVRPIPDALLVRQFPDFNRVTPDRVTPDRVTAS